MKLFIKRNCNLIACAVAFSFLLGVFGPVEFYCSNIYNVWYDLHVILPGVCIVATGIFSVTMVVGMMIKGESKGRRLYEYTLSVLTVCLYIQGTFIKIPYGEMNGETIEWDKFAADDFKNVVLWIALGIVAAIAYKKMKEERLKKLTRIVTVSLSVVMLISMIIIVFSSGGFERKEAMRPLNDKAYTYSNGRNMCVLILDTYDSRVFEDYVFAGNEAKVSEEFEDFTYYRDTMGVFTLTNYAVPQIMTGEYYLGDVYYEDYIEEAYVMSPFLNRLSSEGWNVRFHTDQTIPEGEGSKMFCNMGKVRYKATNNVEMTKGIYKLVAFKYLPTVLKKYVYYPYEYLEKYKTEDTIDGKCADECDASEDSWDNLDFYNSIPLVNADDENDTCQVYHLKGLHALRDLDSDMNYITASDEMLSLQDEAAVVTDIVADWLEKLKEVGIYDDSIIVIMADHGSVEYKCENDNFAQCPLLIIKGYDEHHEFSVSSLPVSYDDIQNIFLSLLDGMSGNEAVGYAIGADIDNGLFEENCSMDEFRSIKMDEENSENSVGRRRVMIYHRFSGNLGGKSKGEIGYELYTDFPAYNGNKIQVAE